MFSASFGSFFSCSFEFLSFLLEVYLRGNQLGMGTGMQGPHLGVSQVCFLPETMGRECNGAGAIKLRRDRTVGLQNTPTGRKLKERKTRRRLNTNASETEENSRIFSQPSATQGENIDWSSSAKINK